MEKLAEALAENFKIGAARAVQDLEKTAQYRAWMQNRRFHEKFAEKVINIVTQVKGSLTERDPKEGKV